MKTLIPFIGLLCLAVLSGCPSVAVKPTASTDQTAKNVADLSAKIDTMNGTLNQNTSTLNTMNSTLNQVTTTTTAQAGATQAMAEKVGRDLENLSSSLGGKIGEVKGSVDQVVKNTSNTNNPWMVWGIVAFCIAACMLILYLVIKALMRGAADRPRQMVQAALIHEGNDLTPDKLSAAVAQYNDLKAKGIL